MTDPIRFNLMHKLPYVVRGWTAIFRLRQARPWGVIPHPEAAPRAVFRQGLCHVGDRSRLDHRLDHCLTPSLAGFLMSSYIGIFPAHVKSSLEKSFDCFQWVSDGCLATYINPFDCRRNGPVSNKDVVITEVGENVVVVLLHDLDGLDVLLDLGWREARQVCQGRGVSLFFDHPSEAKQRLGVRRPFGFPVKM